MKLFYQIKILLFAFCMVCLLSLSGCTATPTASDPFAGLEKFNYNASVKLTDPKVQAIIAEGVDLLELGLALDPATAGAAATLSAVTPLGKKVLSSLLAGNGLPQDATTSLANLALQATNNGKYVPLTAQAVAIVSAVIAAPVPVVPTVPIK
jgi:hypothetical protein